MKNKISDLRNHMFEALERLQDVSDLTPEQIQQEIDKAHAISGIGKVITESAKIELAYAKALHRPMPNKFLELPDGAKNEEDLPTPKFVRPPAVYSNPQHSHAEN